MANYVLVYKGGGMAQTDAERRSLQNQLARLRVT